MLISLFMNNITPVHYHQVSYLQTESADKPDRLADAISFYADTGLEPRLEPGAVVGCTLNNDKDSHGHTSLPPLQGSSIAALNGEQSMGVSCLFLYLPEV